LDSKVGMHEERKKLQKTNIKIFEKLMESQCNTEEDPVLIVIAEGMEHGVTGIAAANFLRRYNKPVIFMIADGDTATGSARSIDGWNITKAFEECSDLLLKYGGHNYAGGLTIEVNKMPEFREKIFKIFDRDYEQTGFKKEVFVDFTLSAKEISPIVLGELEKLAPFGNGNPVPVCGLLNTDLQNVMNLGSGNEHLKVKVGAGRYMYEIYGWGLGKSKAMLKIGSKVNVAFTMGWNSYKGKRSFRLTLVNITDSIKPEGCDIAIISRK